MSSATLPSFEDSGISSAIKRWKKCNVTDSKLEIHNCQLDTASVLSTDKDTQHVRTCMTTVCLAHDRVEVVGLTKNGCHPPLRSWLVRLTLMNAYHKGTNSQSSHPCLSHLPLCMHSLCKHPPLHIPITHTSKLTSSNSLKRYSTCWLSLHITSHHSRVQYSTAWAAAGNRRSSACTHYTQLTAADTWEYHWVLCWEGMQPPRHVNTMTQQHCVQYIRT